MRSALLFIAAATSGFGSVHDDDWPPARFRALGTATVIFATQEQVDRMCGAAPKSMQTEACSNPQRIVLPDPSTFPETDDYARIVAHELGHHFGGWPADHPK